jgi:hypothetical protein
MPPEVRALRDRWPSQVDRVPHLTEELEKDFRFGQVISKTDRGYVMGGTINGGTSSMWYPSSAVEYTAYAAWREIEGFPEARDDDAFTRLTRICAANSIELLTRRASRRDPEAREPYRGFGPLYAICADVLEALPPSHLGRGELQRIQLGGWGPDGAKASAYHLGTVMMYEFAIRGAKRTFRGLFLHELGHAHEHALGKPEREKLNEAWQVLVAEDAFLGVEFLLDSNTRKLYQRLVFNEFLAETYMIYTACGDSLRKFVTQQSLKARAAWQEIYETFKSTFEGIEYD